jgi:hypothetical protein
MSPLRGPTGPPLQVTDFCELLAHRAWNPPPSSALAEEKRLRSLLLRAAARDSRRSQLVDRAHEDVEGFVMECTLPEWWRFFLGPQPPLGFQSWIFTLAT